MDEKAERLKRAGYRYNFHRMVYINRAARKVFSVDAIEDHSAEWLADRIEESNEGEWQFYFNQAPSAAVVRDFLVELGELRAAS
jgi:hypothetical protein